MFAKDFISSIRDRNDYLHMQSREKESNLSVWKNCVWDPCVYCTHFRYSSFQIWNHCPPENPSTFRLMLGCWEPASSRLSSSRQLLYRCAAAPANLIFFEILAAKLWFSRCPKQSIRSKDQGSNSHETFKKVLFWKPSCPKTSGKDKPCWSMFLV